MKRTFIIAILAIILINGLAAQGIYAGTKKSLIGKAFTDSRNIAGLKGWAFIEGGQANSLNDPERIISDVYRKGTTYVLLFSIMEDTATNKFTVIDVVEITGVAKGWTIRSSFCRQNGKEDNYIIVWGKENTAPYMKLIKKAWRFDPDKRKINIIPVKGIDCENIGC